MRRGFTLLEVIVALLLLQVAVVGAVGTLVLASRTLGEAEHVERAVLAAEGLLDSLAGSGSAKSGSRALAGGELEWFVDSVGGVLVRASRGDGRIWLELTSAVALP